MSNNVDLKKYLPASLKNDYWIDLCDALSVELDLFREYRIDYKKFYYDIKYLFDNYSSFDSIKTNYVLNRFLEIIKEFNSNTNRQVDDSLDFLYNEVRAIVLKIKNKGTYFGYNYNFRNINKLGYVYNLYYNTFNLVKALDINGANGVIANLNLADYTLPFTGLTPDLFYSLFVNENFILDTGLHLDEEHTVDGRKWYLDYNDYSQPSSHLAIEYIADELIVEDTINYLMTPTYFEYLLGSSLYNRKVINTLHIGVQLNLLLKNSIYYDYTSGDTHSIPTLETNCITTDYYNKSVLSGMSVNDMFYYMVGGVGKKNLTSKNYPNLNEEVFGYWSFDEDYGDTFYDTGINYNNGLLYGSYIRQKGEIGGEVYFDGVTTYGKVDSMSLFAPENYITINTWFRADSLDMNETSYFFYLAALHPYSDFMYCYYTKSTKTLTFKAWTKFGDSDVPVRMVPIVIGDLDINDTNLLTLVIDETTYPYKADIYIYLNTVLIYHIKSESNIFKNNSVIRYDLYIGCKSDLSDKFKGYISEFKINRYMWTQADITYYYDNLIGNHNFLDNKIFKERIHLTQIVDESPWYIVNGFLKGNYYTNEIIGIGDGTSYNFVGNLKGEDVTEKTLILSYTSGGVEYEVKDDGGGSFGSITDYVSGTINYDTSLYDINFYKEFVGTQELGGLGSNTYTVFIPGITNINPSSFYISFEVSGVPYRVNDDGLGKILSPAIIADANIDYVTGEFDITLTGVLVFDTNITCDYNYKIYTIPDNDTEISVDYISKSGIELTEGGIENINGELVAYTTFPPCKFSSSDYHLALTFCINRNLP